MSFANLGLRPELLQAITGLGFTAPTAIQSKSIPPALAGQDVLAGAETGSGKTAAFLLPVIHQMLERPGKGTRALVLAPTRELAAQIAEDFAELAPHTGLRAAAVYGGVGMGPQTTAFRSGTPLIAATPGRLLDHMGQGVRLDQIEFLIVDEADRMLDMGFLPDIKRILARIPATRQTLFFSATLPHEVATLARSMLKNPVRIEAERQRPPNAVAQSLFPVQSSKKVEVLYTLLKRPQMEQSIVFTRTKHRANRLCLDLMKRGISAQRIHGNRSQAQRTEALAGFKKGKYKVLVATDVAARGIDVEALGHVINFDVPAAPEDYIHRVGRTGRAGATGVAWTLVTSEDEPLVRGIERAVGHRLTREDVGPLTAAPPGIEGNLDDREPRAPRGNGRGRQGQGGGGGQSRGPRSGTRAMGPRAPQSYGGQGSGYSSGSSGGGYGGNAGGYGGSSAGSGYAPSGSGYQGRSPRYGNPANQGQGALAGGQGQSSQYGNQAGGGQKPGGYGPKRKPMGGGAAKTSFAGRGRGRRGTPPPDKDEHVRTRPSGDESFIPFDKKM